MNRKKLPRTFIKSWRKIKEVYMREKVKNAVRVILTIYVVIYFIGSWVYIISKLAKPIMEFLVKVMKRYKDIIYRFIEAIRKFSERRLNNV